MPAKKGHKKVGGRKKGTPNKVPASVKVSLLNVYDLIGGTEAMAAWAENNRGDFYKLWVRTLPQEISGSNGSAIALIVNQVIVRANGPTRLEPAPGPGGVPQLE